MRHTALICTDCCSTLPPLVAVCEECGSAETRERSCGDEGWTCPPCWEAEADAMRPFYHPALRHVTEAEHEQNWRFKNEWRRGQ